MISANQNCGILITGDGASGNLIQGNKIGTDVTGTVALGNAVWGVELWEAAENTVGGPTAGAGNIISGNEQGGVAIRGIDAVGDVVQGNLIGTDATGTRALGNGYSGVYIGDWGDADDAASNATIEENVISANGNWGIWITWSWDHRGRRPAQSHRHRPHRYEGPGKRVQRRRDRQWRGEQYDWRDHRRRAQRHLGQRG